MHLNITVNLEKYVQRLLTIIVDVKAQTGDHSFMLDALAVGNGISVLDWQVTGAESVINGSQVRITGSEFRIRYDVKILHEACLGSGKGVELLYPFLNADEVFFGTGILPVPQEKCAAAFRLSGLPKGWNEFSSLTPGGMHADKLSAFFCYCAPGLTPAEHTYRGQLQEVKFRVLIQRGKSLPMREQALFYFFDGYMNWLELSLAPYQRANEINFLVLQAPPDFAARANQRTFASGENVLNGIACYAPPDTKYLESYFGYTSYAQYLYEGLAHELLHYYTCAAFEGREKSVLYPSPDCAKYAIRLLADALNIYFYSGYLSERVPEARGSFERWLALVRDRREKTGKRQPLLDLQELDSYLRERNSSLLTLFREMVLLKLTDRSPYRSADFLFETMRARLNITPPVQLENDILMQG